MGLSPRKPRVSGENIFNTHHLRNLWNYPTVGQNHLAWGLFENQVLNVSCTWLNTVLQVKTEWLSTYRWFTFVTAGLSRSCGHPDHGRGPHHTSLAPRKTQIQKSKYGFYWMPITSVPSWSQKFVKSNCLKSGTVCSPFLSILGSRCYARN